MAIDKVYGPVSNQPKPVLRNLGFLLSCSISLLHIWDLFNYLMLTVPSATKKKKYAFQLIFCNLLFKEGKTEEFKTGESNGSQRNLLIPGEVHFQQNKNINHKADVILKQINRFFFPFRILIFPLSFQSKKSSTKMWKDFTGTCIKFFSLTVWRKEGACSVSSSIRHDFVNHTLYNLGTFIKSSFLDSFVAKREITPKRVNFL